MRHTTLHRAGLTFILLSIFTLAPHVYGPSSPFYDEPSTLAASPPSSSLLSFSSAKAAHTLPIVVVAAAAPPQRPSPPPPTSSWGRDQRPNVLFIVADDLRPQLGIYGDRASTPHLATLAAEPGAMTFQRAFAQITVCNPSRASFLSGRRPDRTRIFGFEAGSPAGWTTLPEFFRESGYTSLGVGKIWHWGPGPASAWSSRLRKWRDPMPPSLSTPPAWELPNGRLLDERSPYASEVRLPRPRATAADQWLPITGFWPESNLFQQMKGLEQKSLASTIDPIPSGEIVGAHDDGGRSSLPFRDALFASRAIRLMQLAQANTCATEEGEDDNGQRGGKAQREAVECSPWFIAVGFSLPHEPVRFPKHYWDLYGGGGGKNSNGTLTIASTPHPYRPLGSPFFATGDLKEKFVFYEEDQPETGRVDARKANVRTDYGPTKPLIGRNGKATVGSGRRSGRGGASDEYNRGADSPLAAATATLLSSYSSSQPPPPLPPPDLSLLMTAEEVAAIRKKKGNLGAAYAQALTKRSNRKVGDGSSPPPSDLESTVEDDDYWARFAATGAWQDLLDRLWEKPMPEEMQYQLQRGYSAAVSSTDHQIGRLLHALRQLPNDAADRTIVVFTSDHGFSNGDHGGWGKRSLYEPDSQVPLVLKVPPRLLLHRYQQQQRQQQQQRGRGKLAILRGGQRTAAFVELVDIFPSLAELAGIDLGTTLRGSSTPTEGTEGTHRERRDGDEAVKKRAIIEQEPPLDGKSFLPLLLVAQEGESGVGGEGCAEAIEAAEEVARRRLGRSHAITQFPRCPIRYNRVGERRSLVEEPWRTCGAGGFECQGRIEDWTANHELALMGYSLRTEGWRFIAWLRVVRGGGRARPDRYDATDYLNWTWPPYAMELYRHHEGIAKNASCMAKRREKTSAAMARSTDHTAFSFDNLRKVGGAFDLDEDVNVAPLELEKVRWLFSLLEKAIRRDRRS